MSEHALSMKQGAVRVPSTLTVLLHALVGERVELELRHGARVRGVLHAVDAQMNVTLADVSLLSSQSSSSSQSPSSSTSLELMYVAARHITFVHLPPDIDVFDTVDAHVCLRPNFSLSFLPTPSIFKSAPSERASADRVTCDHVTLRPHGR